MGFTFAGTDHGGRPNTSTVIAVVHHEVTVNTSVNEFVRALWEHNDIAGIARKNALFRPEFLNIEGEVKTDSETPEFGGNVRWPYGTFGWIESVSCAGD